MYISVYFLVVFRKNAHLRGSFNHKGKIYSMKKKQLSMKALGKLKLATICAFVVVGMSSCLKTENSLNINMLPLYLLQTDDGYLPQARLFGSDALKSATLSLEGKTYNFSTRLDNYTMELASDSYMGINALDSISTGIGTVTAVSVEEKTATATFRLSTSNKKVGDIKLAQLKYNDTKGEVEIELADTVQNATNYYLAYKQPIQSSGYTMWMVKEITLTGENKLSAKLSEFKLQEGVTFRFAVGASYGTTLRVSDEYITATGGSDSSLR